MFLIFNKYGLHRCRLCGLSNWVVLAFSNSGHHLSIFVSYLLLFFILHLSLSLFIEIYIVFVCLLFHFEGYERFYNAIKQN